MQLIIEFLSPDNIPEIGGLDIRDTGIVILIIRSAGDLFPSSFWEAYWEYLEQYSVARRTLDQLQATEDPLMNFFRLRQAAARHSPSSLLLLPVSDHFLFLSSFMYYVFAQGAPWLVWLTRITLLPAEVLSSFSLSFSGRTFAWKESSLFNIVFD